MVAAARRANFQNSRLFGMMGQTTNEAHMDATDDDPGPTLRKPGPKSGASFATIVPDVRRQHPSPPAWMSKREKEIFVGLTERTRPGFFYSAEPLLTTYVSALAQAEQLARAVAQVEVGTKRHTELTRLQCSVMMLAANLAGKLRLTPRSSVDRYAPKTASRLPRPWQGNDDPA
jgi:hypothetical protein